MDLKKRFTMGFWSCLGYSTVCWDFFARLLKKSKW